MALARAQVEVGRAGVLVARHPNRPQSADYISLMCDEFVELHGDKFYGDDRALRTGFAKLDRYKVLVVGHYKGKTLKERNECFFGCAHPEGYRKAMSKMRLAAKYHLPIICLIGTPGAYPGIGAEERGQAQVIAQSMLDMSRLPTPIICVVIGEGGSGGALGIGVLLGAWNVSELPVLGAVLMLAVFLDVYYKNKV